MAEACLWFVHPQEGDLVISCLNEGIEDIMDLMGIRQEINTKQSKYTKTLAMFEITYYYTIFKLYSMQMFCEYKIPAWPSTFRKIGNVSHNATCLTWLTF